MHKGKKSLFVINFIFVILIIILGFTVKSTWYSNPTYPTNNAVISTLINPYYNFGSVNTQINDYTKNLTTNEYYIRDLLLKTKTCSTPASLSIESDNRLLTFNNQINDLASFINDSITVKNALKNILPPQPITKPSNLTIQQWFTYLDQWDQLNYLINNYTFLTTSQATTTERRTNLNTQLMKRGIIPTTTPASTTRVFSTTTPASTTRVFSTTTPASTTRASTTSPVSTTRASTTSPVSGVYFNLSGNRIEKADTSGAVVPIPTGFVSVNLPKRYLLIVYSPTTAVNVYENTTSSAVTTINIPLIYNGLQLITQYSITKY
jgi:hypothetical protein